MLATLKQRSLRPFFPHHRRITMVCTAFSMSWRLTIPIERRIATSTPPNRLTTQRRLLQRAGGDAHGCSNDALVQSTSNSGPDWADYAHGASGRRDRRSSHHCVRTQRRPHACHSRERGACYLGHGCERPERIGRIRQLVGRHAQQPCNGREERYLIVACTVMTDVPEAVGP